MRREEEVQRSGKRSKSLFLRLSPVFRATFTLLFYIIFCSELFLSIGKFFGFNRRTETGSKRTVKYFVTFSRLFTPPSAPFPFVLSTLIASFNSY